MVYIHNWLSLCNLPFIVNMIFKHHLLFYKLALFGSFEMSENLYFHSQVKNVFIAFIMRFLITTLITLYRRFKREKVMRMHC